MTWKRPPPPVQTFVDMALIASCLRTTDQNDHQTPASFLGHEASFWFKQEQHQAHLPPSLSKRLLGRLLTLLPGQPIGFETGLRLLPSALGELGIAIASGPTLSDALMQCRRFWPIYGVGFTFEVGVADGQCCISVDTQPGVDHRIRRSAIECVLAGIHQCVTALSGQRYNFAMIFDGPEPLYAGQIRAKISSLRYGADHCQYRFPLRLLTLPSTASDPQRYRQAIDRCLAQEAAQRQQGASFAHQVRKEINLSKGSYPDFESISRQMGISTRTLRRRLKEEGVKFSQLLEAAQFQDACRLLEDEELEVGDIASFLGYRERANFSRAFRRWSGACPSEYRQESKRLNA